MNLSTERLITNAMDYLDRAQGDVDGGFSERLTQQSIAYSLIAIAQELHKFNDEADLERARQERLAESSVDTEELGW